MQAHDELAQSADKAAIGLSLVCALHCLLPVAAALLPSVVLLRIEDEMFHRIMLLVVLPVSAFALLTGLRKHRNKSVLAIGVTGLLMLLVAAVIGHDIFGETGERLVTVLGSVLVAISHFRNFQLCQLQATRLGSD